MCTGNKGPLNFGPNPSVQLMGLLLVNVFHYRFQTLYRDSYYRYKNWEFCPVHQTVFITGWIPLFPGLLTSLFILWDPFSSSVFLIWNMYIYETLNIFPLIILNVICSFQDPILLLTSSPSIHLPSSSFLRPDFRSDWTDIIFDLNSSCLTLLPIRTSPSFLTVPFLHTGLYHPWIPTHVLRGWIWQSEVRKFGTVRRSGVIVKREIRTRRRRFTRTLS